MRPLKQIVRITHGSHLYGTSTPSSDLDFKAVHLPSGKSIIHQCANTAIDGNIKLSDSQKNQAGDTDETSYALARFLKMVTNGDTVGMEILFAPAEFQTNVTEEWGVIQQLRPLLVNKQCTGFVGYCQRQAAKYGIKGSRMAACRDLVTLLDKYITDCAHFKLETIAGALEHFCATHEHSQIVPVRGPKSFVPHLEVVDRKVPYTASIKTAYDLFTKIYAEYGTRAEQAMNNENVDWKAVSHAVRVSQQAVELLSTGNITFPRPNADELLAIKLGQFDYKGVASLLEGLVEQVENTPSTLRDDTDEGAVKHVIEQMYIQQVTG